MTAAEKRLLDVRDLTVEIETRSGKAVVVDGIDLHVDRGETLGIVGESGCGKSLTMLSLMRLLPNKIRVARGSALFEGRDLQTMSNADLRKVRGGDIGFVFQDPMTSLNPVMRIGDQICEPLRYHRGMKKEEARARAVELLKLVGIPGPEQRLQAYPHELSGGMRQRVMIAGLVDRVVVLYAGTVVEDAPVDALYGRPQHPYTRGLLASIPQISDEPASRLSSIGGTPPEPGRRPKGCPFAPRCPLVSAVCHEQVPRLETLPGGGPHRVACFAVETVQEAA